MADKETVETKERQENEVTFICQVCKKPWNIKDMRRVTRFRPVLIVCPECEPKLR